MNTRVLVSLSLLVGIGAVLHAVVPPFFFGMKPDMMLTMMFLGLILFPERKNALLLGVTTGVISALTTGFPGGQIPNIIDKPITAFVFLGLILVFEKYSKSVKAVAALTAVGTIISGAIFLTSALLIVGLPGGAAFTGLFLTVVLPTAVINTIFIVVVYPIVQSIMKRTNLSTQVGKAG